MDKNPITIDPIKFSDEPKVPFIPVDEWQPETKDEMIFKTVVGAIMLNVSEFYGMEPTPSLDAFVVKTKRSYNNPKLRDHTIQYLNYFEKFYDTDHELVMVYYKLKYLIDYEPAYSKEAFFYDLEKYIMRGNISLKVSFMNEDNFGLNLTYRNKKNPVLQYNNHHGKILMKVSVLMNCMIPLLCHFMFVRGVEKTQEFLLDIYDILFHLYPDVDLYNKLYETAISNVKRSEKKNSVLWNVQDIRGINATTHAMGCVTNIILNMVPKYIYSDNIIHFNYKSIIRNTGFQIIDIEYEYAFIPLSSSRRDEDMNSEFDKYESFLVKADESAYLQNKVNAESTMNTIEMMYGPFEQDEMDFYMKALTKNKSIINAFQKDLIFNLFYKYFGDPQSINAINFDDYIKLMISAKRILEANGMILLPYIISSRVTRLATRKNVNKKELIKLESSPLYTKIKEKYNNSEKMEKHILGIIAVLLSSDFEIIDYDDEELNSMNIDVIPELVCEEVLMYISLI